jgi:hypothetical protein
LWKPGKLFERSEFLPGWKKYPGAAETTIKAHMPLFQKKRQTCLTGLPFLGIDSFPR